MEVVFIRSQILFIGNIARKSTDISEFTFFTIGINVTVFTTGDAIRSASFFSEGAVRGDVAEGEAAVVVGVRVPLDGADVLTAVVPVPLVGLPLSLLLVIGARSDTSGYAWGSTGAAAGNAASGSLFLLNLLLSLSGNGGNGLQQLLLNQIFVLRNEWFGRCGGGGG